MVWSAVSRVFKSSERSVWSGIDTVNVATVRHVSIEDFDGMRDEERRVERGG
jgi:hypothetical protein